MSASQKATRLPSARDRLLKNKRQIRDLYGLSRQRITQRTIQPPAGGSGSPRGNTAPAGNFLRTEGDTMMGPIAFFPRLAQIVNNPTFPDDDSINISDVGAGTANPPDSFSTYVLVSPVGSDDGLKTIFGAEFAGQLLYLQGTATTIIRLQNGDVANGGNIVTPDGSEFAIDGAKIVTLIFDITISPSPGVAGAWRIMDNRGSAIQDVFLATANANYGPVTGEHVEFNESVDSVANGITVSTGVGQAQGIFSNLLVGRAYLLEAGLEMEFNANTGDIEYQWFDVTGATLIGTKGKAWNIRDSSQVGSQPIAQSIFTPSVDSQVEVRIVAENNADGVLLASSPNTRASYARITELGAGGAGAGGGGTGGINFPILYPIDVIGTAPVSPTTTDIDLSATTAHVHTLDTVGDVTINFLNPPVGLFNITGELIITTNGLGSIVTFSQTTQPTSSFTLAPNTRSIITFQSSDNGATYDVFQAGQAGGGGGATALNDLTDVNLASVTINDIFQFNGTFWINKQSFNFGLGPFGSTGFQRYTNNDIMFSARNAGNTGDLELKNTVLGTLDWTDSGENPVALQARTQHPTDPDNLISIGTGSGATASALLDTSLPRLNFGAAGADRLRLDVSINNVLTLKTQAVAVTSVATFNVVTTHVSDPDNSLLLTIGAGVFGEALIDTNQPILNIGAGGANRLILDVTTNTDLNLESPAGVTATTSFDLISRNVSDPDNVFSFLMGSGVFGEALIDTTRPVLKIGAGGATRLILDVNFNTDLNLESPAGVTASTSFDLISRNVSDPDNVFSFLMGSGVAGEALIETTRPILKIGAGSNPRLILDVSTNTDLNLESPTGVTANTSFELISRHVSDPDNVLSFIVTAGAAGVADIFTNRPELRFGCGGADRLFLDSVISTTLDLEAPAGSGGNVNFRIKADNAGGDKTMRLSQTGGVTGIMTLSTEAEIMHFIANGDTLSLLLPQMQMIEDGGITGSRELLLTHQNMTIDFHKFTMRNTEDPAITGVIAQHDFEARNSFDADTVFARLRGNVFLTTAGIEEGELAMVVQRTGLLADIFAVDGSTATGRIGFFQAGRATRQVVSGSRGGNAALASLLTSLENYGLIVDGTTA